MIDIKKGEKSFYVGDAEEDALAKMEFLQDGDDIIIEHTIVSDQLRGQSVGRKLLEKVVELAREKNKKIIPICPYAKSALSKSDQYLDLLHK
jgi:predicted GNAT family acetyltransferase